MCLCILRFIISEDNNEKLFYYKLAYDVIEGKQYELFLKEIKKIDKKEGYLYIVINDNLETLKNKLKINEIINEEKNEHEGEKIGVGKEDIIEDNKEGEENKEKEDNKEEENEEKIIIKDRIVDKIQEKIIKIDDIFKFEQFCFYKYNKKEENEIRDLIDQIEKPPKKENTHGYDEITLDGNQKDNFIKIISNLNSNFANLNEIINDIIYNKFDKSR